VKKFLEKEMDHGMKEEDMNLELKERLRGLIRTNEQS
jgi:hypothetical protein